jgi:hypothetical protein
LGRLGVGKGDVVATLICRVPFLYVAAMRTMKRGSVYTPLFSAFGPDPIVVRLTKARAGARDDRCAVSPQGRTAVRFQFFNGSSGRGVTWMSPVALAAFHTWPQRSQA